MIRIISYLLRLPARWPAGSMAETGDKGGVER